VFQRPLEDGSRVALRGRRCSSPGPRRRFAILKAPARTPQTLGAMSDLRGSNLTEDLGMIDTSRGPGALSLTGRHTPSAGERWSRGPGSDREVRLIVGRTAAEDQAATDLPALSRTKVDTAPLRSRARSESKAATSVVREEHTHPHRLDKSRRGRFSGLTAGERTRRLYEQDASPG